MTDTFTSADSDQSIFFENKHEAAAAALALVSSAQHELCFLGSELDSVLLDNYAMLESIKQLCIGSSRSRIRLLVDSTQNNIIHSHRLLPLIAKLTSSIELRILSDKHQHPKSLEMITDRSGYLRCLNNGRYVGQVNLSATLMVRDLKQQFEELWNQSLQDAGTRRLNL